jgi:23S rRNA (guanine2445-N2)-methyltransferase / 23S rRNA (guanine2069-N7)-methyltransferase
MKFYATTAKAMEPLLVQELKDLGAEAVAEGRAGASFEGPLETAYRVCLNSRIANRVLLPLKTFSAPNPEKLYGGVKSIRWSDHLDPENTMAVDFASSHSQITHTQFGALKVKDAIVDQIRSVRGNRPSVDTLRPHVRVNVYLHEDVAQVAIDLSGESLHMRGYREQGTPAPMKENLAAAILMLAEWPKAAAEGGAFLDPMCGSGTLPIEAAMMAARIAPGIERDYFGFLKWKQHEPKVWNRVVEEALDREIRDSKKLPKVVGYDQDFRAVRVALGNAEQAGLTGMVHIEKRELAICAPDEVGEKGIVAMNPPYGERMGEEEGLTPLYRLIGDTFKKKFKNWTGYVFTGSPELSKEVGLKASRRFVLFNGPIECRLLKYELY